MSTAAGPTTSTRLAPSGRQPHARPPSRPAARVSFRQPVTSAPHVDGAWWPRSRDLEAELPGLLDVLWTASHDVSRVSYSIGSWEPLPRTLSIGGREVRLGGFTYQDPSMISLHDAWGTERIDILVIPPDTAPAVAGAAMNLASRGGPNQHATQMLERAAAAIDHTEGPTEL